MRKPSATEENGLPQLSARQPAVATASPLAGRAVAFAAMVVIYGIAYFQRTGIPGTIFDELQHDFRLSASAVTALGALFVYVYAGMQLVVGVAADRYGGRRTLLFGSTIMCAGSLLFPCAHSTAMLFTSRALIGFGSSFVYLSIVKEVDTLFAPCHFAGLLGLAMLASYAGNIAATLPFERAVHGFGWRDTLMAVAGMSVVAVVVAWVVLRRLSHVPVHRHGVPYALLWDVLCNRRSRPLLVCGMINFPIAFVIQGVLGKKFLEDAVGLSSAHAAAFVLVMASVCGVAAACGGPVLRLTGPTPQAGHSLRHRNDPVVYRADAGRCTPYRAGLGVPGRLRAAGLVDYGPPGRAGDNERGQSSGRGGHDHFRAQHGGVHWGRSLG